MTTEKAIAMIDEYIQEPNNISKEWVAVLELCKEALLERERQKIEIDILIRKKETLKDEISELQLKNSELEKELKTNER